MPLTNSSKIDTHRHFTVGTNTKVTKGLNLGITNNKEISFRVCYQSKKNDDVTKLPFYQNTLL